MIYFYISKNCNYFYCSRFSNSKMMRLKKAVVISGTVMILLIVLMLYTAKDLTGLPTRKSSVLQDYQDVSNKWFSKFLMLYFQKLEIYNPIQIRNSFFSLTSLKYNHLFLVTPELWDYLKSFRPLHDHAGLVNDRRCVCSCFEGR